MSSIHDDPMWLEFKPLWLKLQSEDGILVAGGYGLFLKQHWLTSHRERSTVVRLEDWRDITPRVTKDFDLVLSVDIISSRDAQARISQLLQDCNFSVKDPRWQFVKQLEEREIILDLHSPLPAGNNPRLTLDKLRVKHKPSLGEAGVHGRQNTEAVGAERHPFQFEIEEFKIVVPNPVTWSVMKLTAMRDRWKRAQDLDRDEKGRNLQREEAMKHAKDVCRVVAMTTLDERDNAADVIDAIKATTCFTEAAEISEVFLQAPGGWGIGAVSAAWRDEDLGVIRDVLKTWFR